MVATAEPVLPPARVLESLRDWKATALLSDVGGCPERHRRPAVDGYL